MKAVPSGSAGTDVLAGQLVELRCGGGHWGPCLLPAQACSAMARGRGSAGFIQHFHGNPGRGVTDSLCPSGAADKATAMAAPVLGSVARANKKKKQSTQPFIFSFKAIFKKVRIAGICVTF